MIQFSGEVEPTEMIIIDISKTDIESGDTEATLQQLKQLTTDKSIAQEYRDSLRIYIWDLIIDLPRVRL